MLQDFPSHSNCIFNSSEASYCSHIHSSAVRQQYGKIYGRHFLLVFDQKNCISLSSNMLKAKLHLTTEAKTTRKVHGFPQTKLKNRKSIYWISQQLILNTAFKRGLQASGYWSHSRWQVNLWVRGTALDSGLLISESDLTTLPWWSNIRRTFGFCFLFLVNSLSLEKTSTIKVEWPH